MLARIHSRIDRLDHFLTISSSPLPNRTTHRVDLEPQQLDVWVRLGEVGKLRNNVFTKVPAMLAYAVTLEDG